MSFDDDLIKEVGPALAYWLGQMTTRMDVVVSDVKDIKEELAKDRERDAPGKQAKNVIDGKTMTWQWALEKVALPIILMGGGALLGFILANL